MSILNPPAIENKTSIEEEIVDFKTVETELGTYNWRKIPSLDIDIIEFKAKN
jgi:hypothetical protein